jgi:hypothetical protein
VICNWPRNKRCPFSTFVAFEFFYFFGRRLWKYSGKNSALYSLRSRLSNEVSLGIPFHLKKKSYGWLRTSGGRYVKTICAKTWARKNKNRPVLGFFTKTVYAQVMNFIRVKVSTLYPNRRRIFIFYLFKFFTKWEPLLLEELDLNTWTRR